MTRKGDTTDWLVRYIPIMILVLVSLAVVFSVVDFDFLGAGTDLALQGHVKQVDQACERRIDEKRMTFNLPDKVENVQIDGGTTYRATMEDGGFVTVEAEVCTSIAICSAGEDGRNCDTGGSIPGGTSEADVYFDSGEAIIDPDT